MKSMSDVSKTQEVEEEAEATASPLLTFAVGVVVIALGFGLIFGPLLAKLFG